MKLLEQFTKKYFYMMYILKLLAIILVKTQMNEYLFDKNSIIISYFIELALFHFLFFGVFKNKIFENKLLIILRLILNTTIFLIFKDLFDLIVYVIICESLFFVTLKFVTKKMKNIKENINVELATNILSYLIINTIFLISLNDKFLIILTITLLYFCFYLFYIRKYLTSKLLFMSYISIFSISILLLIINISSIFIISIILFLLVFIITILFGRFLTENYRTIYS